MKPLTLLSLYFAFGSLALARPLPAEKPFRITIETENANVKSGSEILLKVTLTNGSANELDMSGGFSDTTRLDPNYHFEVRDEHDRPVPKRTYKHPELDTGMPVNRTVRPKEAFTEEQRVSALYDMTRPGKYLIQVWRRASDNPKDGVVKSNILTVIVTN